MGKGWNHPFSLPLCVCAMETKKGTEDSKWSDHLFALTYGGNLYSYLIGYQLHNKILLLVSLNNAILSRSLAGYHPDRVFDFKSSPFLANLTLTTCLCSLREQNLLVVGGNYHIASGSNADPPSALACGLSLWREVSEDPFFSMVATVSQDCSQVSTQNTAIMIS